MVAQPDIDRVGLYEFFIIRVDFDMAPGNAITELPVNENHRFNDGR